MALRHPTTPIIAPYGGQCLEASLAGRPGGLSPLLDADTWATDFSLWAVCFTLL